MPTAESKIIDAHDPWERGRRNRSPTDEATEGSGTQAQVETREQARAPFTAEDKGDCPRHLLGAGSPPGIRTQEVR